MHRLIAALTFALCLIAAVVAARAGDWTDQRTVGLLVCHADFSLRPLEPLLREVADLQADLRRATGVAASKEPIEVYLFASEATYAAYLKQYLPQVAYRRALYVKVAGPGMVFAYQSEQLPVDLRHECTHALLHASLAEAPLWLDEGLAEYFEQPSDRRAHDNPYMARVKLWASFGSAPRVEELEKKTAIGEMGEAEYRDAWAVVHFMLHGPADARAALRSYLGELGTKDQSSILPLSVRLKQHWPEPSATIVQHFREWK